MSADRLVIGPIAILGVSRLSGACGRSPAWSSVPRSISSVDAGDGARHSHRQGLQPRILHAGAHGRGDRRGARPRQQDRRDQAPTAADHGDPRRLRGRRRDALGGLCDDLSLASSRAPSCRSSTAILLAYEPAKRLANTRVTHRARRRRRAAHLRAPRHQADDGRQPRRAGPWVDAGEVVFDKVDFAYRRTAPLSAVSTSAPRPAR